MITLGTLVVLVVPGTLTWLAAVLWAPARVVGRCLGLVGLLVCFVATCRAVWDPLTLGVVVVLYAVAVVGWWRITVPR